MAGYGYSEVPLPRIYDVIPELDDINGVTATGISVVTADTPADARGALGGGEAGGEVFAAATKGAARESLFVPSDFDDSLSDTREPINGSVSLAKLDLSLQTAVSRRPVVDLRDWEAIKNGQWKTTLGGAYTSGQYTMTSPLLPFTSRDVGKIVIANEDPTSPGVYARWMATILSVSESGVATLDTAAPSTSEGQRIVFGFDCTTAINTALSEIAATGFNPREAYLPGYYRATHLAVPLGVSLNGAGWGFYANLSPLLAPRGTLLHQLPGAQRDFVTFTGALAASGRNWLGPVGLKRIALQGPEVNVRDHAPTVGFGFAMRSPGGTALTPQDGCDFQWIRAFNFPGGGVEFPAGVVPITPEQFQAIFNGGYGFDFTLDPDTGQRVHLSNPSADGNVSGAAIFRNGGPGGSIIVTAFKGEAVPGTFYGTTTGYSAVSGWAGVGSNVQRAVLTFENCDQTPVAVNGISNIQGGGSTSGPGPAMRIISDSGKRPNITFAAVGTRVTDSQSGSADDAVTLRDEVADIDIPRNVTSGIYPIDASNVGHTQETVTTTKTLGYFTDHTVLIGEDGAPTLPSAVGRKGARCVLKNIHTESVSVVADGVTISLIPDAAFIAESDGTVWRIY